MSKHAKSALLLAAVGCAGVLLAAAPTPPTVASSGSAAATPRPRSLLLITLDTTRRDALSPYGAPAGDSPNLTRFAAGAARFEEAYSALNVTNPSHLSILTGLPARIHGIFDNKTRTRGGQTSLISAFRAQGYETVAFPAASHLKTMIEPLEFESLASTGRVFDATEVTDRFLRWFEPRDRARPYFTWLHYFDPHMPYAPPKEDLEAAVEASRVAAPLARVADPLADELGGASGAHVWRATPTAAPLRSASDPRTAYAGEVHHVDRQLARVFAALDASGADRDTVVVIVADHGESLGEHGLEFTHAGLFEPTIRIPLLVRVPGLPRGLSIPGIVTHLDIAPTLARLFDLDLGHVLPGRDLGPALAGTGSVPPMSSWIVESAHNLQVARRLGGWKLIASVGGSSRSSAPGTDQLFDLERDPFELAGLEGTEIARAAEMRQSLQWWVERGKVEPGTDVDEEGLAELRALGYVN